MKALTIWQPWASLIMHGVKPYEFRGWPAHRSVQGQRIAIHAGARPVKKQEIADLICRLRTDEAWTTGLKPDALALLEEWHTTPNILPRSAVLGTAILGEPRRADAIAHEFGAKVNDSDRDDHANWAWPLTAIQFFRPPVQCRGAQGFWNFEDSRAVEKATSCSECGSEEQGQGGYLSCQCPNSQAVGEAT